MTAIEAVTPNNDSSVLFRRYNGALPFVLWAEANPQACMRYFAVEDEFDYEPATSINDKVATQTRRLVTVAYPRQNAMKAIAREDMISIERAVGSIAYSSLTNHKNVIDYSTLDEGDAVIFLNVRHTTHLWETHP